MTSVMAKRLPNITPIMTFVLGPWDWDVLFGLVEALGIPEFETASGKIVVEGVGFNEVVIDDVVVGFEPELTVVRLGVVLAVVGLLMTVPVTVPGSGGSDVKTIGANVG
jgi:hypothetical protein